MLSLSKQSDYALLALTTLARREREARATGGQVTQAVPAKEIAEIYGIPIEFLAKVLQKLARAHLVTGTFGPTGGYKLAMEAKSITVGRIIGIIDGGVALTQCMRVEPENLCEHTSRCSIRGPLTRINEEIARVLNTLSLDDITDEEIAAETPLVQIGLPGSAPARLSAAAMAQLAEGATV